MSKHLGTLLVGALSDTLGPVLEIRQPGQVVRVLQSAGWVRYGDLSPQAVSSALSAVSQQVQDLLDDPPEDLAGTIELLAALAEPMATLGRTVAAATNAPSELATDVGEALMQSILGRARPLLSLLALAGLAELVQLPAISANGWERVATTRYRLHPERMGDLLRDPRERLRELTQDPGQVVEALWPLLIDLAVSLDVGAMTGDIPDDPSGSPTSTMLVVDVPTPGVPPDAMRIVLAPEPDPTHGLVFHVVVEPALDVKVTRGVFTIELIAPGINHLIIGGFGAVRAGGGPPEVRLQVTAASTATPMAVLGGVEGPGLVLGAGELGLELRLEPDLLDLALHTDVKDLVLTIAPQDGFVAKLLGGPVSTTLDLDVSWSVREGLRFGRGTALVLELPTPLTSGPVQLPAVRVAVRPGSADRPGLRLEASADVSAFLGPFAAQVLGIGLEADLLAQREGALSPVIRFKPPTGAGLAIDAAAVKGGGFVLFDAETGRYAGVFELTLLESISVKALAIVNTRQGDGTPGFALLVMITAEGFAPIPLGMGFTLTGIGGLLAINHTFDAKAITDGLRSGILDSILFVKDPVKNITRVLSSIDKVFPLAHDRLLVGPLAEISWGTPTMVRIRLALVLELPAPVRLALLAAIKVQLPDPKLPVVDLNIDAAGILDFGKKTFSLDASMHDSKIAGFTLTGDMSLRLGWGDNPGFLASFGGFHPKFQPPPDVRPLQRLALSLSSSDNPRVRFEAYLAVTSNTLQMGARADVHAEAAGLVLDAGGSFDALLQLVPFSLDVAFAAWAKISAGGATLLALSISVDVTGPKPWHITGQATVTILFISATVSIDLTIGEAPATPPVIESVDVGDVIWSQLGDPARWEAALPASVTPGVTLGTSGTAVDGAPLVAHPLSTITVRQQAAPLDHRIDCVGARVPTGGSRTFTATVATADGVASTVVKDQFAPAQFQKLTEDQQLTAPSFVPMNSGVALTPTEESASGPALSWDFALQTLDVTSLDLPASTGPVVAAIDATARGPVDPATDLAQTVALAAS